MAIFSIAVSALRTAFDRQAVTANNIANSQTTAYQARRAHQSELYAGGATLDSVVRDESVGGFEPTGRPLDVAVSGQGYLAVDTPKGARYTRAGSFGIDGSGRVVDSAGNALVPGLTVPQDALAVEISRSGELAATMPDGSRQILGQVPLYTFANTAGLEAVGGGLYSPSASSGPAVAGTPGTGAFGEVIGGFLEGSNVDVGREMVDMLINRTTAGVNAASVRAQDGMLGELLDLKG